MCGWNAASGIFCSVFAKSLAGSAWMPKRAYAPAIGVSLTVSRRRIAASATAGNDFFGRGQEGVWSPRSGEALR